MGVARNRDLYEDCLYGFAIYLCNKSRLLLTVLQSLAVADTLVLISTLLTQSLRNVGWAAYNSVYGSVFIVFYPLTYCTALFGYLLTA